MEPDILVEGFKKSEEMHGVQYLSFVGDSDSSVYAKLKTERAIWQTYTRNNKGVQKPCDQKLHKRSV